MPTHCLCASGQASNPGIGTTLVTVPKPCKGRYRASVIANISATDVNIFSLKSGSAEIGIAAVHGGSSFPTFDFEVSLDGTTDVTLVITKATTAVNYSATVILTPKGV